MANTTSSPIYAGRLIQDYPASSLRLDWAVSLASLWFITGLFLDGWAHNNRASALETFFTPWHGVLYSGFLAVAVVLVACQARNMLRGHSWMYALPRGYLLGLLGVALFSFGGVGDVLWHTAFGIEANIEALLSPTHLLLATGAMLFITSPVRAAWERSPAEARPGWAGLLPTIISLLVMLSLLTFFTQYVHFMGSPDLLASRPDSNLYFTNLYGITSALIPAVLIIGIVLFALRRWQLPRGSLTLLLAANAALMWTQRYNQNNEFWALVVASFAAGVLGDLLLAWLKPSAARVPALRVFAFSLPFMLILFNHLAIRATAGLWWSIHMWLGLPFMAGAAGLLLSFLAYPPGIPVEATAAD